MAASPPPQNSVYLAVPSIGTAPVQAQTASLQVAKASNLPAYNLLFTLSGNNTNLPPGAPGVMSDPFVADIAGRVGKIEDSLKTMTGDVSEIKGDIKVINGKLTHFPTKLQLTGAALGIVTVVCFASWKITAVLLDHAGAHIAADVVKALGKQ